MPPDDLRFELDRLTSYDREAVLAEIRRVAEEVVPRGALTRAAFDAVARIDSSTVVRKFGSWQESLEAAGIGNRYGGPKVSAATRATARHRFTDEEMLSELQRVAHETGAEFLTVQTFRACPTQVGDSAIRRRFGSWSAALSRAGLKMSPLGRTWSDEDYFENLLTVWTHLRRRPTIREMYEEPSRITGGAYEARWGTWMRAVEAFIEQVEADVDATSEGQNVSPPPPPDSKLTRPPKTNPPRPRSARTVPIGLRYKVLSRDRFRCRSCGRSPATDFNVALHVDHVVPLARGGLTVETNLRALCADCNLGKGASSE